jgi:hypothetical protein
LEVHLELDTSQCKVDKTLKCITSVNTAIQIIAATKNQSVWSNNGVTISRVQGMYHLKSYMDEQNGDI